MDPWGLQEQLETLVGHLALGLTNQGLRANINFILYQRMQGLRQVVVGDAGGGDLHIFACGDCLSAKVVLGLKLVLHVDGGENRFVTVDQREV